MSFITISPNMNLPVPNVGQEPGPDWASDINACMSLIDIHDHSNGFGVKINPSGLDINADLTFQGNNATFVRAVDFLSQPSVIGDLSAIYTVNGDLYYNDGAGNQIRITQGGIINFTGTAIPGLVPPASLTYSAGSGTFIFQSGAGIPATIDAGSIIVRDTSAPYRGITLAVASVLSAAYNIYLPSAPPAAQSFVTMDASGALDAPWTVDNSTIKIVANQLVASVGQEEHAWELNGNYPTLTYPLTNIDSIFFAPENITILSVWIYNGTAGGSGTTEFDLKVASSGGSFTSILSTTGKIASTAASNIWTDSGSVIGVQTGVTKPVITTSAITAGQAIRFDLVQSMTTTATDARIRIYYKPT